MKRHSLYTALALAGAVALSSIAYADDTHYSGFFLGAGGGYNKPDLPGSSFSVTNGTSTNTVTATSSKYMFDVYGGYLFDMGSGFDLGPLLAFNYFSPYTVTKSTSVDEKTNIYNVSLEVVGQYTWQSFFTRVGVGEGYFRTHGNQSSGSSNLLANETQWTALAGATVGYYFTPSFDVGVFYQHVFGSTVGGGNTIPRMNSLGLSVEYVFGGMGSSASV